MKKLLSLAVLVTGFAAITSCGNNNADTEKKPDSTNVIIPPPDNSSATNPSSADTNFSKGQDTSSRKKDSIR